MTSNPRFTRISNSANGNCLFETISHFVKKTHEELRENLYHFYQGFDKTAQYDPDSFESKIQLSLICDNDDDIGGLHEDNIWEDRVWASFTDIMVFAHFYQLNVKIFVLNSNDEYEPYSATENISHYRDVSILFLNGNHFEALDPAVPLTKEEAVQELIRLIVEHMCIIQHDLYEFENNIIPEDRMKKITRSAVRVANEQTDPIAEVERFKKCNDELAKRVKTSFPNKPPKMIPKPLTKPVPTEKTVYQEKEEAIKELARMNVEYLSAIQLKMFTFENNIIPEDRMKKIIFSANRFANEHPDPVGELAKRLREESKPNPKSATNNAIKTY